MSDEPLFLWKYAAAAPTSTRDGVTSWVLSTGAVDRDGERVFAPGVDLSEFMRNPVALASHDARSLPVGRWERTRLVGAGWDGRIAADLVLAPPGVSEDADQVRGLIEARMLGAVSIGFLSKRRERGPDGTLDHLETVLLEASLVSIGANPQALRVAEFGRRADAPVVVDPVVMKEAVQAAIGDAVRRELLYHTGALDAEGYAKACAFRKRASLAEVPPALFVTANDGPSPRTSLGPTLPALLERGLRAGRDDIAAANEAARAKAASDDAIRAGLRLLR